MSDVGIGWQGLQQYLFKDIKTLNEAEEDELEEEKEQKPKPKPTLINLSAKRNIKLKQEKA